jgi:hypothetical protein
MDYLGKQEDDGCHAGREVVRERLKCYGDIVMGIQSLSTLP